jgi:hypothetical protein
MRRPEFEDMEAAARVSSFMEPAQHGRWKIDRFTVTDDNVARDIARIIPPGEYVSLRRRATPEEEADLYEDGSKFNGWVPIMSDTPSEVHGHDAAFERAHGRVLITGLGLGVVVSALLAKPEVEHITVVEIDRDVIALTAPYYEDNPKVRIVNYDALAFARDTIADGQMFNRDARYDFAWHDIWSTISDRNLGDDSIAEHGISYWTMFDAYAPFCDEQSAWAYAEAVRQGEVEDVRYRQREEFIAAWRAGTPEQRVELLIDGVVRDQIGSLIPVGGEIPVEIRDQLAEQLGLRAWAEEIVAGDGFDIDKMERDLLAPEDPLGRPNEAKEANV